MEAVVISQLPRRQGAPHPWRGMQGKAGQPLGGLRWGG